MPNRILREGILTSPRMAKLGWAEEVFYRRLMSVVDDFGRYYADAGMLRAACYPRQLNKVSDSDVGKWLRACVDAALVRVYPAEDGESYLELLDFGQQVRAKKSKFPEMLSTCSADATQEPADEHLDVSVDVSVSDGAQARSETRKSSTRCPEDFEVTEEMERWAMQETPTVDIEFETSAMRDHTFAKARSDWPATWRNWMREASRRVPKGRKAATPTHAPWAGAL